MWAQFEMHLCSPEPVVKEVLANKILSESDTLSLLFQRRNPYSGYFALYYEVVCRVGEHQHQLAHRCPPNIIGIWELGIYGLTGGAFMA